MPEAAASQTSAVIPALWKLRMEQKMGLDPQLFFTSRLFLKRNQQAESRVLPQEARRLFHTPAAQPFPRRARCQVARSSKSKLLMCFSPPVML